MRAGPAEDMAYAMAVLAKDDPTVIPHHGDHSPVPETAAAIAKTREKYPSGQQTKQWAKLLEGLQRLTPAERESLRIAWHVKQGRMPPGKRGWTEESTPEWIQEVQAWMSE